MGKPLTDPNEVLLRQIHPNCYMNGRPSSDRFRPQPSDCGRMSVDRNSLTTPAASHSLYASTGRQSAAVFGVSVGECGAETLQCLPDALKATDEQPANAAHALVDYTSLDGKKWKNISKRLCLQAVARGQLHPMNHG